MARLQIAPLPRADAGYLLIIDLVDADEADAWRAQAAQLRLDGHAVGVLVVAGRLDMPPTPLPPLLSPGVTGTTNSGPPVEYR